MRSLQGNLVFCFDCDIMRGFDGAAYDVDVGVFACPCRDNLDVTASIEGTALCRIHSLAGAGAGFAGADGDIEADTTDLVSSVSLGDVGEVIGAGIACGVDIAECISVVKRIGGIVHC